MAFLDVSFTEAYDRLVEENERFHEVKIKHLRSGKFQDSDFFPCWYCSVYYKKVGWLKSFRGHPWSELIGDPTRSAADSPELASAPVGEA